MSLIPLIASFLILGNLATSFSQISSPDFLKQDIEHMRSSTDENIKSELEIISLGLEQIYDKAFDEEFGIRVYDSQTTDTYEKFYQAYQQRIDWLNNKKDTINSYSFVKQYPEDIGEYIVNRESVFNSSVRNVLTEMNLPKETFYGLNLFETNFHAKAYDAMTKSNNENEKYLFNSYIVIKKDDRETILHELGHIVDCNKVEMRKLFDSDVEEKEYMPWENKFTESIAENFVKRYTPTYIPRTTNTPDADAFNGYIDNCIKNLSDIPHITSIKVGHYPLVFGQDKVYSPTSEITVKIKGDKLDTININGKYLKDGKIVIQARDKDFVIYDGENPISKFTVCQ